MFLFLIINISLVCEFFNLKIKCLLMTKIVNKMFLMKTSTLNG